MVPPSSFEPPSRAPTRPPLLEPLPHVHGHRRSPSASPSFPFSIASSLSSSSSPQTSAAWPCPSPPSTTSPPGSSSPSPSPSPALDPCLSPYGSSILLTGAGFIALAAFLLRSALDWMACLDPSCPLRLQIPARLPMGPHHRCRLCGPRRPPPLTCIWLDGPSGSSSPSPSPSPTSDPRSSPYGSSIPVSASSPSLPSSSDLPSAGWPIWILLALAIALSGSESPLVSLWVLLTGAGFVTLSALLLRPALGPLGSSSTLALTIILFGSRGVSHFHHF